MLVFGWCRSQDVHFSQIDNTPLMINPALTGGFQGKARFVLNYRNQWRSITKKSYNTYAFSSDVSFLKEKLSVGLFIYNDKAGEGNFTHTQINLSVAARIQLNRNDFFKVGMQAAWANKRIDMTRLTWNSQYNGSVIDPAIASGEPNNKLSQNYFDMAAGLAWTHIMHNKTRLNVGFGAFHINQPKYSFLSNSNKMKIRWCGHADASFLLVGRRFQLSPSLLIMQQGTSNEINIGAVIKYSLGKNSIYTGTLKSSSVFLGLYYRYKDAIIIYSKFDYRNQLDLCITYDVNVSKFVAASQARGGLEIAVIYIIPQPASHRP